MEKFEFGRTYLQEQAMICIFQYLFYLEEDVSERKPIEEIISDVMEENFDDCDEFFKVIIFESIKNRKEYIEIIQSKLKEGWTFERLSLEDQAILLLATTEIMNNRNEIQVCIDVAVDLAHRYSDETSYKYINKVLDRIGKENAN